MSRRLAAVSSTISDIIRGREMRDRVGQSQLLAQAIIASKNLDLRSTVSKTLLPEFLRDNRVDLEQAVNVVMSGELRIQRAMSTDDDEPTTPTMIFNNVTNSNIAVGSPRATQKVVVHKGDPDSLVRAIQELGADPVKARALVAAATAAGPESLTSDSKVSRAVKSVAKSIANGTASFTVATAANVVAQYLLLFWGVAS